MQSRGDLSQTVTPLHIGHLVKIPCASNMLSGRAPRLPASVDRPDHCSHVASLRSSSRLQRPVFGRCAAKPPLQVGEFASPGILRVMMRAVPAARHRSCTGWLIALTTMRCFRVQAETSHGLIHVAPLELNDLSAASVVLIRSFATSPDSVTVNLKDVG